MLAEDSEQEKLNSTTVEQDEQQIDVSNDNENDVTVHDNTESGIIIHLSFLRAGDIGAIY